MIQEMASHVRSWMPRRHKNRLRGACATWKNWWVWRFRSYGPNELLEALRSLGIQGGDTVLLHSAFKESNGYTGSTRTVTDAFLKAVGDSGTLIMPSLPYTTSTLEYLQGAPRFDVRKTPSRMGLISEFFRRRSGVVRSLNPAHPMLAYGLKADWIVEGHERCVYSCGPGSPFDKALGLDANVVFFDTSLNSMTFFHWLEHHVQDQVEWLLYCETPFEVTVIDNLGLEKTIRTFAFSPEDIARRRDGVLHRELRTRNVIRNIRVGNTMILAARLRDIVTCVDDMTRRGVLFYDAS